MEAAVSEYRGYRIVATRCGRGWLIRVTRPGGTDSLVLRNRLLRGLEVLKAEARLRIDRMLDGAPWQRAP
jgi:hypothetical protein